MLNWLLSHSPLLYFTQSLWRDEAFSVLVAQKPVSFFFAKLSFEPPFYYLLLHYWIKLFGTSEIAVRSLSFLAFILATVIVIHWSEMLFKKHFLSWLTPILFFFNPMLLYYAFEVRTYGWFTFFTVWSLFSYTNKHWRALTIATILGFYTHSYFLLVPAVQTLHWLMTGRVRQYIVQKRWKQIFRDRALRAFGMALAGIAPWIVKIAGETSKLKSTWYYPVDFHLLKSVLGNMYLGYEGTPWYLWPYTAWLSLVLVIFFLLGLRSRKHGTLPLLLFLLIFFSLTSVIGVSFIKPLFVNRYLIPVTVAEVLLVAIALYEIKHRQVRILLAAVLTAGTLWFNFWYPMRHPKLDIRATIGEVNLLRDQDDVILATSPLIFFESIYYSRDPDKVFLYNPAGSPFPWYVGDALISEKQMVRDLPPYPIRAFLVNENGSFDIAYETTVARSAAKVPIR